MKTFLAIPGRFIGLSLAALLAALAPASNALSQPASPVGQWDCIMSGNGQSGILFLNFTDQSDSTNSITNPTPPIFEGIFVQAGRKKLPTGRAGAIGTGRAGTGTASFTNLFGGGYINGSANGGVTNIGPGDWAPLGSQDIPDSRGYRGYWFFNSKGQVVGSYYTVLNATARITNYFDTCIDEALTIPLTNGSFNLQVQFCFTNAVYVTNYPWFAPPPSTEVGFTNLTFTNSNFTIGAIGITNDISFVGKVVPGKRLTLVGSSAFGKFTIRGVPLAPVTTSLPVDGFFWTGNKVQGGFKSVEEFRLLDTGIPNWYGVNGQGPSYNYNYTNSICLISSQKSIGFSINEIPFGGAGSLLEVSRATVGPLINNKKGVGTKGLGDSVDNPDIIQFNANLSPFALP
jgi:hypothetical protein